MLARPRPYRDPIAWALLKHAAQAALVLSVVVFVLRGAVAPLATLSHVATGLLLVGVVVVADRHRYADRDPGFEIVELVAPAMPTPEPEATLSAPTAMAPLVEELHAAMPLRVDVT